MVALAEVLSISDGLEAEEKLSLPCAHVEVEEVIPGETAVFECHEESGT